MPVPALITDLSQTAASNSPLGSEVPTTADDYWRAHASFIALLRDGKGLSAEVDVASAATCDIGAANSPFVRITGAVAITSFGANYNGPRFIRFAGSLTLTHNAATLILPGGTNIVTAAGDTCIAAPISGGWVVHAYQTAPRAYTDVTASRAVNTNYTNTTGRPLFVTATVLGAVNTSTVAASWTVGGVTGINGSSLIAGAPASNTALATSAVIPPGATYQLAATQATLNRWTELTQ